MPFPSEEYYELICRALRAKFAENEDARSALLEAGDRELIHNTGKPERPGTSLPASRFIALPTRIREELRDAQYSH